MIEKLSGHKKCNVQSKMPQFYILSGQFSGQPKTARFFPYLKVVDCPLSCPLYPYMEVIGSLICKATFLWAANWQPTPLPAELPAVTYMEVIGSHICMKKNPMGSPLHCPLPCPFFSYLEVVCCPIKLPIVSIDGSSL